jgi:DNA-binding response OmpR family regulator
VISAFNIEAAWNLDRAIQLAEKTEFDLVTLDLNMPGASGFEVSQRLREIPSLKEKPFIFVSGCATPENIQRAFEIGAADFVEKPFDPRDFLSCIRSHFNTIVVP